MIDAPPPQSAYLLLDIREIGQENRERIRQCNKIFFLGGEVEKRGVFEFLVKKDTKRSWMFKANLFPSLAVMTENAFYYTCKKKINMEKKRRKSKGGLVVETIM